MNHAIVIGGSIAGLLSARVLANHFDSVTVIERDDLPETADFRKGAPQARHAHGLLARGLQTMEKIFPGLEAALKQQGALAVNMGEDIALHLGDGWMKPFRSSVNIVACGRPLIEHVMRQMLLTLPNVVLLSQHEVLSLQTNPAKTRVTGVVVRNRATNEALQTLPTSFVVDASGRHSRLPSWLESLGYGTPEEISVDAKAGYASRIYRQPVASRSSQQWKAMYLLANAPHQSRGGIIAPLDDKHWIVTLVGLNGDYPPTDDAGFLDFAESLPSSRLAEAIRHAEPISEPYGYRNAANRLRKFEGLNRFLAGVVALGDSVYALNPVYGQGMTVAALGAELLDQCLQSPEPRFEQDFQRRLAKLLADPWQLATGQDRRWPVAAEGYRPNLPTRLLEGYVARVLAAMVHSADVAEAFIQVQNMTASPTSLLKPRILRQVLFGNQKSPQLPSLYSGQETAVLPHQ